MSWWQKNVSWGKAQGSQWIGRIGYWAEMRVKRSRVDLIIMFSPFRNLVRYYPLGKLRAKVLWSQLVAHKGQSEEKNQKLTALPVAFHHLAIGNPCSCVSLDIPFSKYREAGGLKATLLRTGSSVYHSLSPSPINRCQPLWVGPEIWCWFASRYGMEWALCWSAIVRAASLSQARCWACYAQGRHSEGGAVLRQFFETRVFSTFLTTMYYWTLCPILSPHRFFYLPGATWIWQNSLLFLSTSHHSISIYRNTTLCTGIKR